MWVVMCLAACSAKQPAADDVTADVFLSEAKKDPAQLLDVRTLPELEAGYVPGSWHVDYKDPRFEDAVDALDRSKTYLVFCASGVRSGRAAAAMRAKGFTVLTLRGGLGAGGVVTSPALPMPEGLTWRAAEPTDSQQRIFSLPNGEVYAAVACQKGTPAFCPRFEAKFAKPAFGRDSVFANPVETQDYIVRQFRSNPISQ